MKLFVPGRICLFGEHSDWAGGYRRINPGIEKGYTLISGIDQGVYAEVSPHPAALVLSAVTDDGQRHGPVEIPMEAQTLLEEARRGGFWSYVAGVAYQALINYQVRGLALDNYRTDLPVRKGLSSSAAICVLAARAFNRLYDLKLTVRGEMELAYQGEITTPSRCGRMDQGCAFGSQPVLMMFDGDLLETQTLAVDRPLYFVITDLQAHKDTLKILERLNHCYPTAETELARGVQALLGESNRRIVHQAVEALRLGDGRQVGALMTEAQNLFDCYAAPACPEELNAPVLHRLLNHPQVQALTWGGKGVGSQGDGSAQFVARSAADQQALIDLLNGQLGLPALAFTLRPGRPVRKAVIPVAGLGTRLFPASRAARKAFFPIVGEDGIARPALVLIIEEALAAGIEEIILVVSPDDREDFRRFFQEPLDEATYARLAPPLQSAARRITQEIGPRVALVVQEQPKGFGHAVLCAAAEVGDEPFLLLLGDHLYRSTNGQACARQLMHAYTQHGGSVIGLRPMLAERAVHYGAAAGAWVEPQRLIEIATVIEKPSAGQIADDLQMPGLPGGEVFSFFGQYILKPQIFDFLRAELAQSEQTGTEVQLTPAIECLRQASGLLGLLVEGQNYDIGLPEAYLETMKTWGKNNT